ncbi:DDE-type integrase/transposase/recombinase [Xanthomonas arboricola]
MAIVSASALTARHLVRVSSRQVISWAMRDRANIEVVVQALLLAIWRRQPISGHIFRSDKDSVYTSDDWQSFLASIAWHAA